MHRRHPIWYGVGFTIIPLFVLILGYINIHPEIHRNVPRKFGVSKNATFVSIDWKDDEKDNPPLEYVSDSFIGTGVFTQIVKVTSFWDLWNTPSSQVEYEWRFKVENLTDTMLSISITYQLEGRNNEIIAKSSASMLAEPGETIEFLELGRLDYRDAQRVTGSGWSISNQVAP